MLEKAKRARSCDELLALASGEGIEFTEDEAFRFFEKLNHKELEDDELNDPMFFNVVIM